MVNNGWGKGHCLVGDLTFESAAYVARYVVKKINGQQKFLHYAIINLVNTAPLMTLTKSLALILTVLVLTAPMALNLLVMPVLLFLYLLMKFSRATLLIVVLLLSVVFLLQFFHIFIFISLFNLLLFQILELHQEI
jgi:hypothetical protein